MLAFGIFYILWKSFSDFLAWCVIPQQTYHLLFDLALMGFFLTGAMPAICWSYLRDYLREDR